MTNMKAAVVERFGALAVRDVPKPTIIAPDDVVVRVRAAGVCKTDLETVDGNLADVYGVPDFPYIPGHETAGTVESVGPSVQSVAPGDAVVLHPVSSCGRCDACRAGHDMYCRNRTFAGVDARTNGGWAEYVRVGERALVPVGEQADLEALAPLADAGLTAFHAINRVLPRLTPTATTVALGVGGVGYFGVQLLKLMTGSIVIAVDSSPVRARLAAEIGADHVVAAKGRKAVEAVRVLTDGGADVVFDFAGSADSPNIGLAMLNKGGALSIVGALGRLQVDTLTAVVNEYSIVFNLVGGHSELKDLCSLSSRGLTSPIVTYGLVDAGQAVQDLRGGILNGRAVLVPEGSR